MSEPVHIISLGAGVQSSTMALMAERGEITPKPNCAIFADTQDEPKSVYTWLDWLEKQLSFPIMRITRGKLSDGFLRVVTSKKGTHYTKHGIPAYSIDPSNDSEGIMRRQCTYDFKIEPIQRQIRKMIGPRKDKGSCIQWLGISVDEIIRIKPSRKKWITNIYPLVDKRMNRNDCMMWMKKNGYPEPPRSACSYCPFHSDEEWQRLKMTEPEAFQHAVEVEKKYQESMKKVEAFRGIPYLHPSLVPLDQIDFTGGMGDLFGPRWGNNCGGHCGV